MNALQVFRYNETSIEFELIDGQLYANATAMCQALGKRPAKWLELESTKRYVAALEVKSEKRTSLIISKKGNYANGTQGTWIHEKLIMKLAQWLDVDFEIWCDEKVSQLLREGQVSLAVPKTQAELILEMAQANVANERRLALVESQVQQVLQIQQQAQADLLALPAPTEPLQEMAPEDKIRRMVNVYAQAKAMSAQDVWRALYQELYYRYRVQVNNFKPQKGESKLQLLKRVGHLDKLYVLSTHFLRVEVA